MNELFLTRPIACIVFIEIALMANTFLIQLNQKLVAKDNLVVGLVVAHFVDCHPLVNLLK